MSLRFLPDVLAYPGSALFILDQGCFPVPFGMTGKGVVGPQGRPGTKFSLVILYSAVLVWVIVRTVPGAVPIIAVPGSIRIQAESPSVMRIE